ncbi:uncharacterized protein [Pyrus communis]|uniref:uncharacterized protein n=1 Tax=Pyrus communis TaxID=23211 RepID=UPI0035C0E8AF
MANLAKLDFVALNITGKNYLTWVMDTKIYLEVGNLGETIKEENSASSQDLVTTIFICRHFDEGLKNEISSQMKLCGETITEEDMLEKTFNTFHASNVLLQHHYRKRGFIEYNQLISVLFVAEQNNELLMKNHQSQFIGSAPFPKVNVASLEVNTTSSRGNNYKRGCSDKRGRWNRKGKNYGVQFYN